MVDKNSRYLSKGFNMGKNWKTTTAGVGMLLAVVGGFLGPYFDGNPATNPDYQVLVTMAIAGVGLLFAKDYNVTGGTKQQ